MLKKIARFSTAAFLAAASSVAAEGSYYSIPAEFEKGDTVTLQQNGSSSLLQMHVLWDLSDGRYSEDQVLEVMKFKEHVGRFERARLEKEILAEFRKDDEKFEIANHKILFETYEFEPKFSRFSNDLTSVALCIPQRMGVRWDEALSPDVKLSHWPKVWGSPVKFWHFFYHKKGEIPQDARRIRDFCRTSDVNHGSETSISFTGTSYLILDFASTDKAEKFYEDVVKNKAARMSVTCELMKHNDKIRHRSAQKAKAIGYAVESYSCGIREFELTSKVYSEDGKYSTVKVLAYRNHWSEGKSPTFRKHQKYFSGNKK